MSGTLNDTPKAQRLHIGFFGRTNSGKSSLINYVTGQEVSIVSSVAGTTTDPVYKAMEINPIGPCMLIDTAGFDDVGQLGEIRMEKTLDALYKTDVAVLVFHNEDMEKELLWYEKIKERAIPFICVLSKVDLIDDPSALVEKIKEKTKCTPVEISAKQKIGFEQFKEALQRAVPSEFGNVGILGDLVKEKDTVLLVMPQDIQAPKGRLILPQVQTIRELLDKKCTCICCVTDTLQSTLDSLKQAPSLIICDSQVFAQVYSQKPKESKLTSFSVLFAGYKGDIKYYAQSASAIEKLKPNSRILIAECCTHAPLSEDIGRVKIPGMLRKKYGKDIEVDICSGTDFPADLSVYDLIIQCGGCMFNRNYVMSRIDRAKKAGVPMTNYGVAIAHLTGILDKIEIE